MDYETYPDQDPEPDPDPVHHWLDAILWTPVALLFWCLLVIVAVSQLAAWLVIHLG